MKRKGGQKEKLKVGVLVSGNGSNLQAIIDAIERGEISNAEIAIVLSDNPEAFALERAKKHGIPAEVIKREDYPDKAAHNLALAASLKKHGVKLVCLAGYMRIVSAELLNQFPNSVMNIHPALLPSFPGLHAQKQAFEHGVKISGCTVHFADPQVDAGPIIIQAAVPVHSGDTEKTLADRILVEEHKCYPLAIKWFAEGRLSVVGRNVVLEGGEPEHFAVRNP
ncbi:Phosphoribosylglycinamide formyltransferase [uncultured archaeon]|nr:Phosphoribosylglycinamide formyltransferase [uncultured archaeon]